MLIDLEPIFSGLKDSLVIDEDIEIPSELLEKSSIKRLNNVHFVGKIKRLDDLPITISGNLTGVMILLDDIDLSEVEYKFDIPLDEELEDEYSELIVNNELNLLDLLWQLIQVEVPSKIHGNNKDIKLSGDGWKLISEEEVSKNNAFSDLDKMLQERSQK